MASDRGGGGVGDDYLDECDQEYDWDVEDEGDPGDWQEYDVGGGDIEQAAGYQLASREDDVTTMERGDDCQITSSPLFPCTDDQPVGLSSVHIHSLFPESEVPVHERLIDAAPCVPLATRKRRRVAEVLVEHTAIERPVAQDKKKKNAKYKNPFILFYLSSQCIVSFLHCNY